MPIKKKTQADMAFGDIEDLAGSFPHCGTSCKLIVSIQV